MFMFRVTARVNQIAPTVERVQVLQKRDGLVGFLVSNDNGCGKGLFWEPVKTEGRAYYDTRKEAYAAVKAEADERLLFARAALQRALMFEACANALLKGK